MLDCNVCISLLRPVSPVRLALLDGNQYVSGVWMEVVIQLPIESLELHLQLSHGGGVSHSFPC